MVTVTPGRPVPPAVTLPVRLPLWLPCASRADGAARPIPMARQADQIQLAARTRHLHSRDSREVVLSNSLDCGCPLPTISCPSLLAPPFRNFFARVFS